MAIYKRDIASINLETGTIHRTFLNHSIGYKDQKADHFGIRVFRDGEPVDLTGVSVQGVFMPPQGDPIAITSGNIVSGNEAEVVLPQACYNYDGQFCLAIKLVDSNNSVTGTMRIVDGMVDNTHASGTVAPTSAVPTYQEILSTYDAMVAATAAANGAIAATYSSSSTYKVGDYCIHDGGLYRCTTAITTAEAWTSGHWTAAKIGPDVSDLKSALSSFEVETTQTPTWSAGSYYSASGEPNNESVSKRTRIRTSLFSYDTTVGVRVVIPSGMKACIYQYDSNASNTYIKWSGAWATGEVMMYGDNKKYKLVTAYTNDADIATSAGASLTVYCLNATDKTLSIANKPADAQTVGNLAFMYKRLLESNEYLDNIKDNGIYVRYSVSDVIPDSPTVNKFVMLIMGNPSNTLQKIGILISLAGDMFIRYKDNSSSWGSWVRIAKYDTVADGFDYLKNAVQSLYNNQLTIYGNLVKGARSTAGQVITSVGITTNEVFKLNVGTKIDVSVKDGWVYTISEGNSLSSFKYTHRLSSEESFVTSRPYVYVTLYKTEEGETVETAVSDYDGQIVMTISAEADELDLSDYVRVIPENFGVANVIRRAYQMTKISFNALADIPHFGSKIIEDGTKFTGVPYSSVRPENLYVPQCVSIDSFMTALKNPNSYIYTRRMNIPGYSGHTYEGAVCSSFVAWSYGIDDTLPTTVSFANYPGFNELPTAQQNWRNVRLGDMLNKADDHIVLVTDIFNNRFGEMAYVELSESTNANGAKAQSNIYYRDKITTLIASGYRIYRYENIADVAYTSSPWVHVDASEQKTPTYNDVIIPRRGDKANWHEGEDIVIDILEPEGYTGYTLTEDYTSTTTTGTVSATSVTLTGLTYGAYRFRLTGSENSGWIYFDVKKTQGTTYEVQSGRKVKVTPFIDHGTMASVAFCCNNPNNGPDHLAVRSFHIFTSEEIAQGYAIVDAPPASATYAVNDVWYMRCMYKTDFGLYSGQLTAVDVTLTGTTVSESAYELSQYIEDYPSA